MLYAFGAAVVLLDYAALLVHWMEEGEAAAFNDLDQYFGQAGGSVAHSLSSNSVAVHDHA